LPGRRGDRSGQVGSVILRRIGIAGLALAVGTIAAAAQAMKSPRIEPARVDWDAVAIELATIDALKPAAAGELVASLNRATGERFANISASAVPVLLPFDTAAFLRDRNASPTAEGSAAAPAGDHLAGFNAVPFFYPGPAGYDAVVVARAQEMRELGIGFSDPIYIHIGGSAVVYELDEPVGMIGWPVHGLDDFPGIRRTFLENYVRYTFVRYGAPYVVAIECFDGGSRYRKIACRDADKVAVRFLKALRVVGGAPQPQPPTIAADTIDRPAEQSTVFTYHSPGDIIPGTGFRSKSGVADYTVYSKIRFPIADAPAFANSQSFMNWGNCEATGRYGLGRLGGIGAYRCRVNAQPLISDESAADNYSYPWRDNFCETRHFYVGQCPGGLGHQGQDIRPASCKQRVQGANRCEPYLHDVVAVRDGAVLRAPGQEALYIVVNAPNERVRFRYLHMQPKQVDAAGMVSGTFVREGEVIGKVGNFFKRERATTYHLHFDMQVPTKYGWVFINPYMTLVAAYERLIRGRGQELRDGVPTASLPARPEAPPAGETPPAVEAPATTAAKPTETTLESRPAEAIDSGTRQDDRAAESALFTASVPTDTGGGDPEHAGAGAGEQVRPLGRGFSHPSARAWHFRRHLHAGHEQHQARHDGL
jgi:murein DD-endopeptidase MepM/ murein hydrolase activator NlpD